MSGGYYYPCDRIDYTGCSDCGYEDLTNDKPLDRPIQMSQFETRGVLPYGHPDAGDSAYNSWKANLVTNGFKNYVYVIKDLKYTNRLPDYTLYLHLWVYLEDLYALNDIKGIYKIPIGTYVVEPLEELTFDREIDLSFLKDKILLINSITIFHTISCLPQDAPDNLSFDFTPVTDSLSFKVYPREKLGEIQDDYPAYPIQHPITTYNVTDFSSDHNAYYIPMDKQDKYIYTLTHTFKARYDKQCIGDINEVKLFFYIIGLNVMLDYSDISYLMPDEPDEATHTIAMDFSLPYTPRRSFNHQAYVQIRMVETSSVYEYNTEEDDEGNPTCKYTSTLIDSKPYIHYEEIDTFITIRPVLEAL